jgi:hypothetical protein
MSINLLPREVVLQRRNDSSFSRIYKLCIFGLVIAAFVTAVVLAVRVSQRLALEQTESYLTQAEAKINSFKDRETQLAELKEYLSLIKNLSNADLKKKSVYNLVAFLAPPDVTFSDVSIGSDGSTVISASSRSLVLIDQLVTDLSSKDKNADLISKIDLDGFTLGKDSTYRFGIRITVK